MSTGTPYSEPAKLAEWQYTDSITGKPDWERIAAALNVVPVHDDYVACECGSQFGPSPDCGRCGGEGTYYRPKEHRSETAAPVEDDPFCWYIVTRGMNEEYETVFSEAENCPGPNWKPLYATPLAAETVQPEVPAAGPAVSAPLTAQIEALRADAVQVIGAAAERAIDSMVKNAAHEHRWVQKWNDGFWIGEECACGAERDRLEAPSAPSADMRTEENEACDSTHRFNVLNLKAWLSGHGGRSEEKLTFGQALSAVEWLEKKAASAPSAIQPTLTERESVTLKNLISLARALDDAMGDAEEMPDGKMLVEAPHANLLELGLACLDELPDDQPQCTMSGPAKAEWALRRLVSPTDRQADGHD